MSLATKVLLALIAGLGAGLGLDKIGARGVIALIEPVGTIWVAALRMPVIPLIVALLITAVGGPAGREQLGRLGARALLFFVAVLSVSAAIGLVVAPPVFARMEMDPASVAALRESAVGASKVAIEGAKTLPSVSQWLVDLVPVNPIRSAADGAVLPLIVFSLTLGAAIGRIPAAGSAALLRVIESVRDACVMIIHGVLAVAPIGVFALAVSLATKLGTSAAGVLATYVIVVCGLNVIFCLVVVYPMTVTLGGVRLRDFINGALPAQAVAFSARSSLAALPAMLDAARDRLKLSEEKTAFILPVAVALFRGGATIGLVTGVSFLARLYGVDLSVGTLGIIGATAVATSFTIPGIPSGSIIMMVPVILAAGVPAEGVGILLGADIIPDMFRTTTNVTCDMAAAAVLGRSGAGERGGAAAGAAG